MMNINLKSKFLFFLIFLGFALFIFIGSMNNVQATSGEYLGIGWTAPTTNSDNSAYTDPGGFIVYYDTISHSGTCPTTYDVATPYSDFVNVADSDATHTNISGLTHGSTYYFTIVAYNSSHVLSDCTTEVSHTVKYSAIFGSGSTVGLSDWSILHSHYGESGGVSEGDANRDGVVNISDWAILHAEYGL